MKKYNILFLLALLTLGGCILDNSGELADQKTSGAATIDIPPNQPFIFGATESIDLVIDATKFSDESNIKSVMIQKSFEGANASVTGLDAGSVTSYPSTVSFSIDELLSGLGITIDEVGAGDTWTFNYVVTLNDGRVLNPAGTTSVPFSCQSDLAGMYSVTTTYGYHDFLPSESTNTIDVEITETGPGQYEVFDFSGGLYSQGAYATYYGTSSFTVTFNDVCNSISWTDQSDTWGPVVPLDGGVNSVDPVTGVITISWHCLAYGENGVSVYTPK